MMSLCLPLLELDTVLGVEPVESRSLDLDIRVLSMKEHASLL